MSIADIEKVREAEAKAAQIKKSSEEAAAQIIADGKKESKVLLEDAEKKGTETYKAAIAFAETKAWISALSKSLSLKTSFKAKSGRTLW